MKLSRLFALTTAVLLTCSFVVPAEAYYQKHIKVQDRSHSRRTIRAYERSTRGRPSIQPRTLTRTPARMKQMNEGPMHSEAECAARMQLLTELEEAMGRVLSGRRNLLARDSIMKIFDSKRSECGMDSAEKDTEEAEAATSTFQVKCKGINNRNELEECLMEQRRLNRQRLQKTNSY